MDHLSEACMGMPGQTWPGAAASCLGMWIVMMVAMMLPSLTPMLWRYRQAMSRTSAVRTSLLTALVAIGYFFVWTVFGMAAFPLGAVLAAIEIQQPAVARDVPIAIATIVLVAGLLQLTAWKARQLACCRNGRDRALAAGAGAAAAAGCGGVTACAAAALLMIARHRSHGPSRDGCRDGSHHRQHLAPAGERVARAIVSSSSSQACSCSRERSIAPERGGEDSQPCLFWLDCRP
jgi:hypothetical protein